MKFPWLVLVLVLSGVCISFAQPAQKSISRVSQMPDLPSPYLMRDWKQVATQYDAFVFDQQKTGTHLPLIELKNSSTNFPNLHPILLDTYVGTTSTGQAEAINIIPALVSASLMNIDKSNQNGVNWVEKVMDFYNSKNNQNVYLNSYNTLSGKDWWYDLMPNVFFYQLYTQYPNISGFDEQFVSIADQWLRAVQAMGGKTTPWTVPQMNYRGWYLSSMTGNAEGVKEPEAAGAIAWLLYQAWKNTGEQKYFKGAMLALDFLSAQNSNPSYELQLPYGVLAAAKMNAVHDAGYDIEKMVNWCFDRGPLRGWGVIDGQWNGSDVSGLIGEANDAGNDYAFAMNGFQQAAALVPLMKYDKRFARDIAKWTLNLANASRLFYPQYLPQTDQDDHAWSAQYDPQSVIAYEALKEDLNGKKLYGTGDAKKNGWAQTNLGIYGSSHAGYLGAVAAASDVNGILLLDLNATDFFGENAFPSYALYNPHTSPKQVTLALGSQIFDIYNAITETTIVVGATGNTIVTAPSGEVMLLVYLPVGGSQEIREGKLFVDDKVADYHYGYDFQPKFRIRSLDVADTLVEFDQQSTVYSTIQHAPGAVSYNWYVDDVLQPSSNSSTFTWTAPHTEGSHTLKLEITSGVSSAKDSILFEVVESIPEPPVITGIISAEKWYGTGAEVSMICEAMNNDGGPLTYAWTFSAGTMISQNDSLIHWRLPQQEGIYQISCKVTNKDGLYGDVQEQVLAKTLTDDAVEPLAYYPMDGDGQDHSGHDYHGTVEGVQAAVDARGEPDKAWRFSSGDQIIYVENKPALNFQDEVTLAFWIRLDAAEEESFIISHGSWEERFKVSITPERKLRWTVKTPSATLDLDSSFPLELDHFYHFTVLFTGYSMELYAGGLLDTFLAATGPMPATGKPITFGRKDRDETRYSLKGTLDEVRLYDKALAPDKIPILMSLWDATTALDETVEEVSLYPNPSTGVIIINGIYESASVTVTDITGRMIAVNVAYDEAEGQFRISVEQKGMVIILLNTAHKTIVRKVFVR